MCPQGTSASQSAQPKPAQVPVALLKVTSNISLHTCLRPRLPLNVGTSTLHPGTGSPRAQEKAPDSLPSSCLSHSLQGQVTGTGSWCKREDSANASHQERRPPGSVDRKRAWNPEGQHASNQQIHFGLILSSLGCTSPARSHKRERRKTAREGLGVSRAIQASSSPAWADGRGTR